MTVTYGQETDTLLIVLRDDRITESSVGATPCDAPDEGALRLPRHNNKFMNRTDWRSR